MADVKKQHKTIPLTGKLMTADPATIGSNFQTLTNMRYTDTHPKSILGNTKINTTALSTTVIQAENPHVYSGKVLFDCEFEGTFVDSVNGFTPTVQNCTIETEDVLFGSGSCFMDGSDENLPASGAILTYITNSEFVNRCAEEGFTLSLFIKLIDPMPGYPAGSRIHFANVLEKASGGYNFHQYLQGIHISEPYFLDDATVEAILLLNLAIGTPYRWIIDGFQIIKGAVWTEDFTPPTAPFISTLNYDPLLSTYLKTRNAFHFRKVQPSETHLLMCVYNTGLTASQVLDWTTAIS